MGQVVDREVWQKLAEKAHSSLETSDPPGPRFTHWVLIVAAVSGVVMLAGLIGMIATSSSEDAWFGALIVLVLGAITFAISGQHLINEGARPTLPASDPASLVEIFLSALSLERWDTAKACLARVARVRTERPEFPSLGLKGQTFNLALDQYFEAYWSPLCADRGLTQVTLGHEVKRVEPIEAGLSVIWVTVTLSQRTDLAVAAKTVGHKFFGRLVAYRRGDSWHLLYGGVPLGADVRLPVQDDAIEEVPQQPELRARSRPAPDVTPAAPEQRPNASSPEAAGRLLGGGAGAKSEPSGKKISGRLLGKAPSGGKPAS